jgi:hypothetical protein
LWPRDLQRLGKSGPDQAPEVNLVEHTIGQRSAIGPRTVRVPEGIDPGFEYAPGSNRLRNAIPPERPDPPLPGSAGGPGLPNRLPLDPLPPPRPLPATELLPKGLPERDYVNAYLDTLGVQPGAPAIVRDAIGERLVVGEELFQDTKGNLKVTKRGREQYMKLLARALVEPDEIWARLEWIHSQAKAVVRRRYVARYLVEGQETPALAVFELGADGWSGITTFQGATQSEDEWRIGVLLYQRLVP